ncbi:hypothetical protein DAEQUDRAFT_437424 [Daedalea quercina L-15889]|uniref:Uncharacterized protein n=1 Tax=Daedalea quercina L-15889 TaxID=1314783 RepID=A0A165NAZ5_9APHY|nr:hypothetical protein DAEQUDRAFT_437424 [Daedalea quercina L-15889]
MATLTLARQQLQRVAAKWPSDPFRPNLQLRNFLESLAKHPNLTLRAAAAARALQDDHFLRKYPLSDGILRPASMPQYYTRLVEGYEKSAKGIGRPWWKVFFGIW